MAISQVPFSGSAQGNVNRANRITFLIGPVKTAAHVVHPTGSKGRYDKVRDDSTDPDNVQVVERNDYITEES